MKKSAPNFDQNISRTREGVFIKTHYASSTVRHNQIDQATDSMISQSNFNHSSFDKVTNPKLLNMIATTKEGAEQWRAFMK